MALDDIERTLEEAQNKRNQELTQKLVIECGLSEKASVSKSNVKQDGTLLSFTISERGVYTTIFLEDELVKVEDVEMQTINDEALAQHTNQRIHTEHIEAAINLFGKWQ